MIPTASRCVHRAQRREARLMTTTHHDTTGTVTKTATTATPTKTTHVPTKATLKAEFSVCEFLHDVSIRYDALDFFELRRRFCPRTAALAPTIFAVNPTRENLSRWSVKQLRMFLTELGCSALSGSKTIVVKRLTKELRKHKLVGQKASKKKVVVGSLARATTKTVWVDRYTFQIYDAFRKNCARYTMHVGTTPHLLLQERKDDYKIVGNVTDDGFANLNVDIQRLVRASYPTATSSE